LVLGQSGTGIKGVARRDSGRAGGAIGAKLLPRRNDRTRSGHDEVERMRVVDDEKYLRFNAQKQACAILWYARAQTFAGVRIS